MTRDGLAFRLLALCGTLAAGRAFGAAAAGASAAPYLKMPMGARATGMGEAFTGIANDTEDLYYNPAGLSQVNATEAAFMQILGFGGINYSNLALAVPAENLGVNVWGTVGFNYTLISIPDILRTRANQDGSYDQAYADNGYTFTSGGTVVSLAYAWQATKMFSLGATAKFINEKVDTFDGWGYAGDIGLFTKPAEIPGLSAGLTIQNLGQSPDPGASLPVTLRLGAGYTLDHLFTPADDPQDKLTNGVDIMLPIAPIDGSTQFALGTEYSHAFGSQSGALRVGYRFPEDLGAMAGLTAGMGYTLDIAGADISLNYAWVPYGVLGMSNEVELTGSFGGPKPKARKPATPPAVPGATLTAPRGLLVVAGDRRAQVSWDAVPGATGYNIFLAYKPAGPWYKLTARPLQATAQTVGSLYNNVPTYFSVQAVSGAKEGPKASWVEIVPKAGLPAQPSAGPPPMP